MHHAERICLIEDDPIMGESLADRFRLDGFSIDWFRTGGDALAALETHQYAAVISDVRLPDVSGEEVFERIAAREGLVPPFVFITAFASVERAVRMLKQGAADYVTKPFDIGELVDKIQMLVGVSQIVEPRSETTRLGVSSAMRELAASAPRIAQRARIVLITGDSGVGKEVVAQYLHSLAPEGPQAAFIAVNCGGIPETLLEDEFFGHEKGAFTGAERARKGFFEQAHGGTLFLDEIGELPLAMQVKLLRAIQERRIQRLGSEKSIPVELRIVCATNKDLQGLVEEGRFREDLYYRVNVVNLRVPSLKNRPQDILWLARQFLAEQALRLDEPAKLLSATAQAALLSHCWPGNVRELKNRIERACVFVQASGISSSDLFEDRSPSPAEQAGLPTLEAFLAEAERSYIESALARNLGKVAVTAAALGVSRKTLWEKTKRFGIGVDDAVEQRSGREDPDSNQRMPFS